MSADLVNQRRTDWDQRAERRLHHPGEGKRKFSGHPGSSPRQRRGTADEADTTVLAQAPKPTETLHK